MKAVYINKHGGVDVLEYGDVPEPTVDAGQVKVQVKSACLNRLDLYTREGDRGLQREFPLVLYWEEIVQATLLR